MSFESSDEQLLVSVIICVRNSEEWLEECLDSIIKQTYGGQMEVSIFNDGSSDRSLEIITEWQQKLKNKGRSNITLVISSNDNTDSPKGVGYAKNRAVEQSHGKYLCFFDSDDIMNEERVEQQLEAAQRCTSDAVIVGAKVCRIPEDSTPRYINWANNLNPIELQTQIYTCFGPTILMPTWFCSRATFDRVIGGFAQKEPKGVPEDLLFFYDHLRNGGKVVRVDKVLLTYRYHKSATTFSVTDETIWAVRLAELERNVLSKWSKFTIWNAGKEGRRLYRSLSEENRQKVMAFADVDAKKIAKKWYTYEEYEGPRKPKVAVIHFSDLKPPVVICVKLGLSNGNFERNLNSLNLREGLDFVHFG